MDVPSPPTSARKVPFELQGMRPLSSTSPSASRRSASPSTALRTRRRTTRVVLWLHVQGGPREPSGLFGVGPSACPVAVRLDARVTGGVLRPAAQLARRGPRRPPVGGPAPPRGPPGAG